MSDAVKNGVKDGVALVLSGVLYAIALKYFVLPSRVILTGMEGIAASLSYYFESESLFLILYLVFHGALILFGMWKLSKSFALRTLAVVAMVALMLTLLPELTFADPEPTNERIILVLFGGILAGVAKALAFRARGSAGDEDIVAAYFASKYLRPVGSIAVVAAIISTTVGLALALLKTGEFEPVVNTLMYTCVYIFVSTEALNTLYRKFHLSMLMIVTKVPGVIGASIRETYPHRTYTVQDGFGGHSGDGFQLVRAIVTHEELPDLIDAVEEADPNCFYSYHDVEGVSRRYYITPVGAKSQRS